MNRNFPKTTSRDIIFDIVLLGFLFELVKLFIPDIVIKIAYTCRVYFHTTQQCFPHYANTAFTLIFLLPQFLLSLLSLYLYRRLMDYCQARERILKVLHVSPFKHLALFIAYTSVFIVLFFLNRYVNPLRGNELTGSGIRLDHIFLLVIMFHLIIIAGFYSGKFLQLLKTLLAAKRKEILLLLGSLTVILLLTEFGLRRIFNITPGVYADSPWFKRVDTLSSLKGYCADSDGIFKVDPETALQIHQEIASHNPVNLPDFPDGEKQSQEIYILERDFLSMLRRGFSNGFTQMVKRTKLKPVNELNELDSAILHYIQYPINSDGFRGIKMETMNTKTKKILLLGDSFAWGNSASNITNSFADILLSKGYVVYNTGIAGADPAQYLAVARKYIPLLKPDIVVVNFFMGNDIIYFRRPVLPQKPIFYATNAGNLYACPNGIYLNSAHQTYDLVSKNYSIPAQKNWFNWFCSKTATGTLVWKVLYKFGKVDWIPPGYEDYWRKADSLLFKKPYSNIEIDSIKTITENNKARFLLVAIPDVLHKELSNPQKIPYLFEGLNYYTSPVKSSGYNLRDGHFNDEGHKKYAEFLDSLIRTSP